MDDTGDASPFDVVKDVTISEVSRCPEISGAFDVTFLRNAVREGGRALRCSTATEMVKGSHLVLLHETVQTWGSLGKRRSDFMSHRSYYLSDRYFK